VIALTGIEREVQVDQTFELAGKHPFNSVRDRFNDLMASEEGDNWLEVVP
jgi:hypothetical protein